MSLHVRGPVSSDQTMASARENMVGRAAARTLRRINGVVLLKRSPSQKGEKRTASLRVFYGQASIPNQGLAIG